MNIQNHIITAFHLKARKISGNLGTALIAGTGIWTVSEIDYNPPVSCWSSVIKENAARAEYGYIELWFPVKKK